MVVWSAPLWSMTIAVPRSGYGWRVEAIHELDEHFLEAGLPPVLLCLLSCARNSFFNQFAALGPATRCSSKKRSAVAADPQLEKEIADAGLCSHLWLR
jgi:hypothetical protein